MSQLQPYISLRLAISIFNWYAIQSILFNMFPNEIHAPINSKLQIRPRRHRAFVQGLVPWERGNLTGEGF